MNPSDCVLHCFSAMTGPAVNRQVAAFLREEILSGRLKAGERLPPLRRLSELRSANYFSMQLATEELMRDGLLKKFSGKGIYVCECAAVAHVGIFVSKRRPLTEYNFSDTLLFFLCRKLEEREAEYMIFQDFAPALEKLRKGGFRRIAAIVPGDSGSLRTCTEAQRPAEYFSGKRY